MLLADDTKSYQEIRKDPIQRVNDGAALQNRIDEIAKWAVDWRMEINAKKS